MPSSKYNIGLQLLFLLADIFVLSILFVVFVSLHNAPRILETSLFPLLNFLIPGLWLAISLLLNLYSDQRTKNLRSYLKRVSSAYIFLAAIILLVVVFGKYNFSRILLFLLLTVNWLALLASAILRWAFWGAFHAKGFSSRLLIFIGRRAEIESLKTWLSLHPEFGYANSEYMEIETEADQRSLIDQFLATTDINPSDELVIGASAQTLPEITELIFLAEERGMRVRLVQNLPKDLSARLTVDSFGPFRVINVRKEPLDKTFASFVKRGIDIGISLFVLTFIFWWFYLLIALIIKATSKGPVIFTQQRVGQGGKHFVFYKFRSMQYFEGGEAKITQKMDDRVTWTGRLLRKSNLDELPQFLNVLKGEMSVVGPRPHMVNEDEKVSKLLNTYKIRHFVKPGITGWAAVNGYRGGTEDMDLMQMRVNYDVEYIENWTVWLDIKIFFLTIGKMITFSTDAY